MLGRILTLEGMNILLNILVSGIAVAIASYLTPGVRVDGYLDAMVVAVFLALVNSTIGPLLKFLTLPLDILTLGLISLIINVLMVLIVGQLVPGFSVDGFWVALIFAVLLSAISITF
jgi:putative membrane protein